MWVASPPELDWVDRCKVLIGGAGIHHPPGNLPSAWSLQPTRW